MNEKPGMDRGDREMTNIPNIPKLVSISPQEQQALDNWWRKTREVLRRYEDGTSDKLKQT